MSSTYGRSLEELEKVEWKTLHANIFPGDANMQIPVIIRGLASDYEGTRNDSYSRFIDAFFHQGTLYEATPVTVPFLIRLIETSHIHTRLELIETILDFVCATGHYRNVQQGALEKGQSAPSDKYYKASKGILDAVCNDLPLFFQMLRAEDADTQAYSALILAAFPEERDSSLPELITALGGEEKVSVRAALLWAIGVLVESPELELYENCFRSDPEFLIRAVVARFIMFWKRNEAHADVVETLILAVKEFDDLRRQAKWLDLLGDFEGALGTCSTGAYALNQFRTGRFVFSADSNRP